MKLQITNYKLQIRGFSIIEMLISIALLAIIMIVATQSLASSLKNSRKSDNLSKTRSNTDYAISTIERLLRNAQSVTCPDAQTLNYVDEYGNAAYFRCDQAGGFIASNSATTKLTSTDVRVICNDPAAIPFQCPIPGTNVPATVLISIKAQDVNVAGAEGATVVSKTRILLRNYIVN